MTIECDKDVVISAYVHTKYANVLKELSRVWQDRLCDLAESAPLMQKIKALGTLDIPNDIANSLSSSKWIELSIGSVDTPSKLRVANDHIPNSDIGWYRCKSMSKEFANSYDEELVTARRIINWASDTSTHLPLRLEISFDIPARLYVHIDESLVVDLIDQYDEKYKAVLDDVLRIMALIRDCKTQEEIDLAAPELAEEEQKHKSKIKELHRDSEFKVSGLTELLADFNKRKAN